MPKGVYPRKPKKPKPPKLGRRRDEVKRAKEWDAVVTQAITQIKTDGGQYALRLVDFATSEVERERRAIAAGVHRPSGGEREMKCAYCGGNNFHTTFCEVPSIDQQREANANHMRDLQQRLTAAEGRIETLREKVVVAAKETHETFTHKALCQALLDDTNALLKSKGESLAGAGGETDATGRHQ